MVGCVVCGGVAGVVEVEEGVDDAGVDVLGMVEAGCVVVGEAVGFVW